MNLFIKMTTGIEAYRYSIGIHNLTGRNCQFKFNSKHSEKKVAGRFTMFSRLVLLFILLSSSCSFDYLGQTINESNQSSQNVLPDPTLECIHASLNPILDLDVFSSNLQHITHQHFEEQT